MKLLKHFDPDLKRIYRYFLDYKFLLCLASVFMLGSASMSTLTATLLGKLTDEGFYNQEAWVIVAAPLALIGVTLLYAVSTVMSTYLMAKVSQAVLIRLRTTLFTRMLRWPAQEYQKRSTGLVSSKFVNEAAFALSDAANSVIVMVRDSAQIVALLAVLFWQNWQLTCVTFIITPVLALVLRLISKRMKKIVRDSQTSLANMISRVQESYEAERIVKVSGTYDFEDARFERVNDRIASLALKTIKMQSLSTPVTQMLTMVAVAFVVAVALIEAQQQLLTMGEFITFLSALLLLKAPVQHLSDLNATFARISAAARSIFDMMDAPLEDDEGKKEITRARGDVSFESVSFRYPGQDHDALRGVSFTVRAGEHLGIVGESGSGKTTLMNLIPRFLETTGGVIRLDGDDVRDLTLASLRAQIAIVSQSTDLINGSIRDNLLYGMPDVTQERLEEAVEAAGLTDWVRSLPKGLDTSVGEEGSLLSGGQKQRLSIARALLKNAPVLLLDEATSALDSKTEEHVKQALANVQQGRTCITVAHRFASIMGCDRILVVQHGEVVEEGTPGELLAAGGRFAALYALQQVEK